MTREEAQNALDVVAKIKAHPDYKTLGLEEMKILQDRENEYRAVATGQEERIAKGMSPEPKTGVGEMALESAKDVGRQLHGMGAAALQSLPGVVPAIEAAGDLLQEGLRGHPTARKVAGAIVPPSGTTEGAIQDAPLPIAARAFGALSPMAAATGAAGAAPGVVTRVMERITPQVVQRAARTTGQALNLAQTPATVAYQAIQKQAARLPLVGPGTSHAIAGGATGVATGAVDAGLRRVAPAALGQDVPPLDVPREILLPGVVGTVGAALPGVHNMMTRKGYQPTEGSDIANTFVKTKQSGREQDPTDPLFGTGRGDLGVGQVAEKGRRLLSETEAKGQRFVEGEKASGQADVDSATSSGKSRLEALVGERKSIEQRADEAWKRRIDARKIEGAAGVESAKGQRTRLLGQAAEATEPQVRGALTAQDKGHREAFNAAITRLENDHIPQGNLFGDMEALVATRANERGQYLNSGERLREVWKGIKGFIDTGRVRDYRTALTELKTLADRGTPEQAWVAQQLHGGIKKHMKDSHPGIAQAYDEYRTGQSKTGRGFNAVYGDEAPRDIGQKSPDPDDPYIDVLPTREVQARKRLTRVGDPSAEGEAWRPVFSELEGLGLKPQIESMRNARAQGEAGVLSAEAKAKEGVSGLSSAASRSRENIEAATAEKRAAALREIEGIVGEATRRSESRVSAAKERADMEKLSAEEMATDALKAKHAVEMSRFPGYTEVLAPVAQGITAMTGHNPGHSAAVAGMAGATFARRLGQFAQSNIALRTEPLSGSGLPVGAASQAAASFTPGAMSLQTALARKRPEDQASDLVQMARSKANGLRVSIGDLLKAKN